MHFQERHGNVFDFLEERILSGSHAEGSGQRDKLCAADFTGRRCNRGENIPAA